MPCPRWTITRNHFIRGRGCTHAARQVGAKPGRFVCLEVMDTGCGMTAETLSRILNRSFPPRSRQGTGLGSPPFMASSNNMEAGLRSLARSARDHVQSLLSPSAKRQKRSQTLLFIHAGDWGKGNDSSRRGRAGLARTGARDSGKLPLQSRIRATASKPELWIKMTAL